MTNIRKIEIEDAKKIQQIALDLHISNRKKGEGFLVAQPTLEEIGKSDKAYVCEDNNELLGFTLFYTPEAYRETFRRNLSDIYPNIKISPSHWFGYLIGVKPERASEGIGSLLIENIFKEAKKSKVKSLYAEVVDGNPSLLHHIEKGWFVTGEKREYIEDRKVNLIKKVLYRKHMTKSEKEMDQSQGLVCTLLKLNHVKEKVLGWPEDNENMVF